MLLDDHDVHRPGGPQAGQALDYLGLDEWLLWWRDIHADPNSAGDSILPIVQLSRSFDVSDGALGQAEQLMNK
jgi:hypothetical protein